ncbi:hypothetical protein BJ742DRAFT_895789 [Cladochytrium replicatum]|nr:hypothetical protein BJ742DRAFT_895789 [Cladochytrium replicatum]
MDNPETDLLLVLSNLNAQDASTRRRIMTKYFSPNARYLGPLMLLQGREVLIKMNEIRFWFDGPVEVLVESLFFDKTTHIAIALITRTGRPRQPGFNLTIPSFWRVATPDWLTPFLNPTATLATFAARAVTHTPRSTQSVTFFKLMPPPSVPANGFGRFAVHSAEEILGASKVGGSSSVESAAAEMVGGWVISEQQDLFHTWTVLSQLLFLFPYIEALSLVSMRVFGIIYVNAVYFLVGTTKAGFVASCVARAQGLCNTITGLRRENVKSRMRTGLLAAKGGIELSVVM